MGGKPRTIETATLLGLVPCDLAVFNTWCRYLMFCSRCPYILDIQADRGTEIHSSQPLLHLWMCWMCVSIQNNTSKRLSKETSLVPESTKICTKNMQGLDLGWGSYFTGFPGVLPSELLVPTAPKPAGLPKASMAV